MTSAWAAQHHSPSWSLHKLGSEDYPCDFLVSALFRLEIQEMLTWHEGRVQKNRLPTRVPDLRPWWSYSHLKLSMGGQTALVRVASQRSGCKWVVCCPDYISGGDAGQDLSPPFLTWLFNCSPAGPPFLNVLIAPPSLQQPINLDSITRCCPTLTHTDPLRDALS